MKNLVLLLLLLLPFESFSDEEFYWRMNNGMKAPETESQKSINGFGAWLLVTPDKDWEEKWKTPRDHTPSFTEAGEVELGGELIVLPFFANPKLDNDSNIHIVCDIQVVRPDGSLSIDQKGIVCAKGRIDVDPMTIFLSGSIIKYVAEEGDQVGTWGVYFTITDVMRDVAIPLQTSFKLVE